MLNSIGIAGISLLIVALAALGILIIVFYTESQIRSISQNIIEKKINEVNVLDSRASIRLSDAATVMTITGSLPQITSRPNVSLMTDNSHGVPQNAETEKRFVARIVLKEYPNFETVSFLLSNGDVYLIEPYERQKNITLKNFAFRDYYKGVKTTDKPSHQI